MTDEGSSEPTATRWRQAAPWLAACLLALSAGAAHQWQTTRIGALGDFAYILDTAWRIAQGEVMYRDFVLPHSPLTFHVQATLIKLFGFSYGLTVWYCTAVNVTYVLLTYQLMRILLPPWSAVGLCAPLVWLAPHTLYPHPFYDPDAALLILLNLNLLHWVMTTQTGLVVAFLCGMTTVLPALAKQNIGYPYAGLVGLGALWWGWFRETRGASAKDDPEAASARAARRFMYGILGGALATLGWLAATCGLENYLFWVFVSASRRLARPTLAEAYGPWLRWASGLALVAGWRLWLSTSSGTSPQWMKATGLALLLSPFLIVVAATFLAERFFVDLDYPLLSLWVPVMLLAVVAGVWQERTPARPTSLVKALLLWACLTVTFFSFLSQAHYGSSYGIWALFFLMLSCALSALPDDARRARVAWGLALMMTVAAVPYVQKNVRLRYVDQSGDNLQTLVSGPLKGFTTCAPYLSDFVELLAFAGERIPPQDLVACIPQEEPFYVLTGRRNPLRIVAFDRTANPLSPAELVEEALRRQARWVVLKKRLQMKSLSKEVEGVPERFLAKYDLFAELDGYVILHRPSSVKADSL
ncbi:MAG: hypothetical protein CFK52_01575 [Chloracidobacterium sp. CP2_5A]|nr:MAG: hypothetical protein CFK52_01575 [Chloracidobacterium sp. CP2_5A]